MPPKKFRFTCSKRSETARRLNAERTAAARRLNAERTAAARNAEQSSETPEQMAKRMVMTFRVSELQMLLGFAGKNKTGRKNELQARALEVVRGRAPSLHQKIKDLYKSIQLEMMSFGDRSQAGAAQNQQGNMLQNTRVPSAINSIPGGHSQSYASGYNMTHNQTSYSGRSSSNQSSGYSMQSSHNSSYPINPDVKLKKLPFFDILGELLKPCSLAPHGSGRYHEASFNFSLTPQQANKIAMSRDMRPGKQEYTVQVQMRFCLLETTCEQEDNFPPNINVKINEKMCPLPAVIPTNKAGVEPKRPSRPVNVTGLCKISPTVSNRISVTWSSDFGRCYVISCYLVQKLTSEDLLQRLKSKGSRLADFTKSLIKQKLIEDGECEIATTSLRCSLMCPLGKMRMSLPCRAETCSHLQCFDASLFLQMNERKPTWTCPVCDKPAIYDNLVIDGYFQEVLSQNSECNEVTLQKDGSWLPLMPKKEQKEQVAEKKKPEVAVETLSDDSDDDAPTATNDQIAESSIINSEEPKKRKAVEEVILLSDSDDDTPPPKRQAMDKSDQLSTIDTSELSSEGTKSNDVDSWHIGEVDPGKRLVFRKSQSTSNGGNTQNNGTTTVSTGSSRSNSPQIICLDSPSSSPTPTAIQNSTSSVPTTAPPPYSSFPSTDGVFTNTENFPTNSDIVGSELNPLMASASISSAATLPIVSAVETTSSSGYLDPLLSPSYLPTSAYDLSGNMQSLFNPMINMPPTTTANSNLRDYRPADNRYM